MTVRNADTIVVMNQGQLAEKGSHEELLAAGGIYASLVERQNSDVECRTFDMAPTIPEAVQSFSPYTSARRTSSTLATSSCKLRPSLQMLCLVSRDFAPLCMWPR